VKCNGRFRIRDAGGKDPQDHPAPLEPFHCPVSTDEERVVMPRVDVPQGHGSRVQGAGENMEERFFSIGSK
jgi:hypothetical protein